MNKERQRIAIAKACGWKENHDQGWGKPNIYDDDEPLVYWHAHELPNYLNDLNAMHEAEKSLLLKKQMLYQGMIGKVTGNKCPALFRQIHATAAQRAEAFLRALNLWNQ
jgi:hypothetical protein